MQTDPFNGLLQPPRRGRQPLFSDRDCAAIAAAFDGTTAGIDALLVEWSRLRPSAKRHNIIQAARRGGYKTARQRKGWSADEDAFVTAHWHHMSADQVATALSRSFNAVNLRRKRLGIGVGIFDGNELTVRKLEDLTGIDHCQWNQFIKRGWLRAPCRERREGAPANSYLSPGALRSFFASHPEVYDYRNAPEATRVALQPDLLPDPPRWKLVTCHSSSLRDEARRTPAGRMLIHGAAELQDRFSGLRQPTCADEGGTRFWAPLYALPQCPRCRCQVSRYSEEALFTDLDPGDDELIDTPARRPGVRWAEGPLRDEVGTEVDDRDRLGCLVGDDRRDSRLVTAFENPLDADPALRTPVRVMLVEDPEHKHEFVGDLLRRHQSVVVICASLADGAELELRYGIPFIHGKARNKLQLSGSACSVVLSRVCDARISVPHCEVTVDHSGPFGSRMRSLQHLERLMHSCRPRYHCILMTPVERYERFPGLVEEIRSMGFEVSEETVVRDEVGRHAPLPPALRARVSARDNPFLSLLGWRMEDLIAPT